MLCMEVPEEDMEVQEETVRKVPSLPHRQPKRKMASAQTKSTSFLKLGR